MSMHYTTDSVVTPKRSMFYGVRSIDQLHTIPITIAVASFRADSDLEGIVAPDGFIPPGTAVAYNDGGTYDDLYTPYLPGASALAVDAHILRGFLWDPVGFTRDSNGDVNETVVSVAMVPIYTNVMVLGSKFPEVSDHSDFAGGAGSSRVLNFVAGTLSSTVDLPDSAPMGVLDVEPLGITGIAGH